MAKILSASVAFGLLLAGCSTSYIAPEPVTAPLLGQPTTSINTERLVPVAFDQAWRNLQAYSKERYRTVSQNKTTGEMTLFVDAFEPENSITCGMTQTQDGMFDSHREFLSSLSQRTAVNLNITVQVKLSSVAAKQTRVTVNTNYDMTVGYQTNPTTGAIVGGTPYRFDSKGSATVNAQNGDFAARCQPTGAVEAAILGSVAGN